MNEKEFVELAKLIEIGKMRMWNGSYEPDMKDELWHSKGIASHLRDNNVRIVPHMAVVMTEEEFREKKHEVYELGRKEAAIDILELMELIKNRTPDVIAKVRIQSIIDKVKDRFEIILEGEDK